MALPLAWPGQAGRVQPEKGGSSFYSNTRSRDVNTISKKIIKKNSKRLLTPGPKALRIYLYFK